MKNAIVSILNLRHAEKQVGCIQHQSAKGNEALILAFVAHENYLDRFPRTKDITAAMDKSPAMVTKYLNRLCDNGKLDWTIGQNANGSALDIRAKGWYVVIHHYSVTL